MTGEDIRCPVRIPARAGFYAQRCVFHTGNDGICPAHGDVCEQLKRYRKTRLLTDEVDLPTKKVLTARPSFVSEVKEIARDWLIRKLTKKS